MRAPTPPPAPTFWWERVTYRSFDTDRVTETVAYLLNNPAEAVRRIRVEVRTLASALPPWERERAFEWADFGGSVHALGALHRGQPCGFSLSHDGNWIEWAVHPVAVPAG